MPEIQSLGVGETKRSWHARFPGTDARLCSLLADWSDRATIDKSLEEVSEVAASEAPTESRDCQRYSRVELQKCVPCKNRSYPAARCVAMKTVRPSSRKPGAGGSQLPKCRGLSETRTVYLIVPASSISAPAPSLLSYKFYLRSLADRRIAGYPRICAPD